MGAITGDETRLGTREGGKPAANRVSRPVVWLIILAAALILSRWALAPRYLITFDEINFALAIDDFNPGLHQPQPPGYPVFVAFLKFLALFLGKVEAVFLIAAVCLSLAALLLLWRLCIPIVGLKYAIIGPLLLLFNPAFWLSALTNPVRLCLAAGALGVALCLWHGARSGSGRWFVAACLVLGLSAGARPILVLLMAPLAVWAAIEARIRWRATGLSLACFIVGVATWLPSLVIAVGGPAALFRILRGYSGDQFGGTSLLFGASIGAALHMAWEAIVWSCLGILSWFWIVPLLRGNANRFPDRFVVHFLAFWFFPGLLFYATVHVGDPDHTLAIVPVTCIAGALAIAALARASRPGRVAMTVAVCVLLNVFLFVKPISKTAKASTYAPVRWMGGFVGNVIDGVRDLNRRGPVTAVFRDENMGWRHLSYYEPQAHIVVLLSAGRGQLSVRHILDKRSADRELTTPVVAVPGCGLLVIVDPAPPSATWKASGWKTFRSGVWFTPAVPGRSYTYGGFQLAAGQEACPAGTP